METESWTVEDAIRVVAFFFQQLDGLFCLQVQAGQIYPHNYNHNFASFHTIFIWGTIFYSCLVKRTFYIVSLASLILWKII